MEPESRASWILHGGSFELSAFDRQATTHEESLVSTIQAILPFACAFEISSALDQWPFRFCFRHLQLSLVLLLNLCITLEETVPGSPAKMCLASRQNRQSGATSIKSHSYPGMAQGIPIRQHTINGQT